MHLKLECRPFIQEGHSGPNFYLKYGYQFRAHLFEQNRTRFKQGTQNSKLFPVPQAGAGAKLQRQRGCQPCKRVFSRLGPSTPQPVHTPLQVPRVRFPGLRTSELQLTPHRGSQARGSLAALSLLFSYSRGLACRRPNHRAPRRVGKPEAKMAAARPSLARGAKTGRWGEREMHQ